MQLGSSDAATQRRSDARGVGIAVGAAARAVVACVTVRRAAAACFFDFAIRDSRVATQRPYHCVRPSLGVVKRLKLSISMSCHACRFPPFPLAPAPTRDLMRGHRPPLSLDAFSPRSPRNLSPGRPSRRGPASAPVSPQAMPPLTPLAPPPFFPLTSITSNESDKIAVRPETTALDRAPTFAPPPPPPRAPPLASAASPPSPPLRFPPRPATPSPSAPRNHPNSRLESAFAHHHENRRALVSSL